VDGDADRVTEPGTIDPGAEPGTDLDFEADRGTAGEVARLLVVLVVVVGLLLLLAAAAHPSGAEGCGGG
jgi:hypothetical protein